MVTGRAKYQRGIALLATMLAIALMTVLVVDFTSAAALGYRGAANQANELRAYYLARSGVQVGLALLQQSAIANAPAASAPANNGTTAPTAHDSLDQPWALPAPPVPVDGGMVSTFIVDEDRKLNVNLLLKPNGTIDPAKEPVLNNLLANIGVSPDLLPVLEDWLDADSIERDGGAEADYYLRLSPPYEPRNGPIPTLYDLRMLKGMDDATFFKLARYLTALPIKQVNVNTAPPEVLAALAPQLENDPSVVKEIIGQREAGPFVNTADLKTRVPDLPQDPKFQFLLATTSSFFTITGEGDFAGARKRIYSTFKRGQVLPAVGAQFTLAIWHED